MKGNWIHFFSILYYMGFPGGSEMVKNLPVMQVRSLGQKDPLEKGMATHSSILAWRIQRTEKPGRLQSLRSQRGRHDWGTNTFTHTFTWPSRKLEKAHPFMIVTSVQAGCGCSWIHIMNALKTTSHSDFFSDFFCSYSRKGGLYCKFNSSGAE